ncbi:MAG: hypothetical protein RL634_818 [Bacteroidota bacterium]|jgi:Domain of unknown function (DUF4266)|nr:DUF4266 domain-containing protein [Chitinophagia bacterium]
MKQKILFRLTAILSIPLSLWSCMAVKPYQKGKLNDAEMELSARKVERGEMGFMSYREGASGANGGKAGGGCGCN